MTRIPDLHASAALLTCVALLALATRLCAAAPADLPAPFTNMTCTESGPGQAPDDIARRIEWPRGAAKEWQQYRVADERFGVYVPKPDGKDAPQGLLVFVWPGGQPDLPAGWREVLDREKLIMVCPVKAGNDRDPIIRMALTLDAVWNARKQFAVDDARILVSGVSGGGRIASMAIVAYPEVFTGAVAIVGCNYYRDVRSIKQKGLYQRSYTAPPARILAQAKLRPLVLLEGENDGNQDQSLVYSRALKADGFRYITYVEVPGMGHGLPPVEWFGRAVTAASTTQPALKKP